MQPVTKKTGYHLIVAMLLIFLMMGNVLPSATSAQEPGVPETIDLVLVIDNSDSLSGVPEHTATDPFNLRIATTRALIDVASTDFDASRVRVGVIAFGSETVRQTEKGLTKASEIARARDVAKPARQGNTVIATAFKEAYLMLEQGGSYTGTHNSAVIFMTDGRPYDGKATTPEDFKKLFDDAQPWIDKLAAKKTPVYIAAFNPDADAPVIDLQRWQAFARTTGGDFYAVKNIDEAAALFDRIMSVLIFGREPDWILSGQRIRPTERISQRFTIDAFLDRATIIAVHANLEKRSYIEARLFGPDGNGGELEIRCGQENIAAAREVRCRGLEQEDTDTVWMLIQPQPGTWRVEFIGGDGYIKAWKTQRAFGLVFVKPRTGVLLPPGSPLDVEIGLCETSREARESCQKDPAAALVGALNYKDEFMKSLQMNLTIQEPTGAQARPIAMSYKPGNTRFTYSVTQQADPGVYRLDAVLYYGEQIKRLGANSITAYVGYLPAISSLTVTEKEDDKVEGLSAYEPLELRVLLQKPELAIPGSLTMVGSTLIYPNGDQVTITPTVVSGVNNAFVTPLGLFEVGGTYTVEAKLTGSIQVDKDNTLDFGGPNQPAVTKTLAFVIQPPIQPQLKSITVPSATTIGETIPVRAEVVLSRREAKISAVTAKLLSSGGQTVISTTLTTADKPYPSGQLTYVGNLRMPNSPGGYTVQVSLPEGKKQTTKIVVEYPLPLKVALWLIGLLVLAAVGYGIYWYTSVRDLVPRVVIGSLKIERKMDDGTYKQEGDPVGLSRQSHKEIPLSVYAPDPEVSAVNARLVGYVKNRRERSIWLKMDRETDNVMVDGVGGKELPLVDGSQIITPNYRITYASGDVSSGSTNLESGVSSASSAVNI